MTCECVGQLRTLNREWYNMLHTPHFHPIHSKQALFKKNCNQISPLSDIRSPYILILMGIMVYFMQNLVEKNHKKLPVKLIWNCEFAFYMHSRFYARFLQGATCRYELLKKVITKK